VPINLNIAVMSAHVQRRNTCIYLDIVAHNIVSYLVGIPVTLRRTNPADHGTSYRTKDMVQRMLRTTFIALTFVLTGLTLPAAAQEAVRIGVQAGAVVESYERRTLLGPAQDESMTTGMAGITMVFPLGSSWFVHCAPQYSQRNYASLEKGKVGASTYVYASGQIDRLGVPILLACTPLAHHFVRPYIAAGVEFGMNLSGLHVKLSDFQYKMEPAEETVREHVLPLTQLFGAGLLEAGFDIYAGESLSVIFAGRYTQEFGPLVDGPLYSHGTPNNWTIRLGLLYELPH